VREGGRGREAGWRSPLGHVLAHGGQGRVEVAVWALGPSAQVGEEGVGGILGEGFPWDLAQREYKTFLQIFKKMHDGMSLTKH